MGSGFQQLSPMIPPLSVEQIASRALEYDFDPLVPLRYWLRSAGSLAKEVSRVSLPSCCIFPGPI
jgi:hypothetical protein